MSSLSRRKFLKAAGTTALVVTAGKSLAAEPTPDAGTAGFSPGMVADAEALAGVQYTAEERKQLAGTVAEQLAMVRARRAVKLDDALAPATHFDPRLPSFRMPTGKSSFRSAYGSTVPPLPGTDEELAFAPIWMQSRWLKARKVTSEKLTRLYLDRLKTYGPKLECVARLTEPLALEQARNADRELAAGRSRGPLHGIPFGAKDLFDTAGIPTTWGAEPYKDRVPSTDAWVIARLREAGAVLLAKTTLGALAYGDVWADGKTRNPWFPEEGSSGSSAGSAAGTAAGLLGFGLGTETLGSIVSPSMRCGTTGLRPTFGRIPRLGAMALCWSLDKVGPLCRAVEDTALVLSAIHGQDPADPSSIAAPFVYDGTRSVRGLKVGYVPAWFEEKKNGEGAEAPDLAALEALKRLGVQLVELKLPELPYEALIPILLAEAAAAFEDLTLTNQDDLLDWQSPDAWPNTFRAARFLTAVDVIQADRLRRRVMEGFDGIFAGVDAIAGPSFAGPMLTATNFTGHPSLTLRSGFVEIDKPRGDGEAPKPKTPPGPKHRVPYGFTLWGKLFDEGTICTLGVALERELGVASERPKL